MRGLAQKIVLVEGRATGVEIARSGGIETISARREVIIAASSINSPKLLMLSGIGPAAHLAEHGINVAADRPGVGQNLQDHLELYIQRAASQPISLYKYWNLLGKAWVGAQWLFARRGPGASNQFESAAFIRSAAGVDYPDLNITFCPLPCAMMDKLRLKAMGFRLMSALCVAHREARSLCGLAIRLSRQKFCSTICQAKRTGLIFERQ